MNELLILMPSPLTIARARALRRLVMRALATRCNRAAERRGDLLLAAFALAVVALAINSILSTFVPMLRGLIFLY